jgi:hypothetical protein
MSNVEIMQLPSARRHDEESFRFNYRGMHRYIVTLPAAKAIETLAEERFVFPILNAIRDAAAKQVFDVFAYCFFPKKLVFIIRGHDETSDMKEFLSDFKTTSTLALDPSGSARLWDKRYTERVLRKSEESRAVALSVFKQVKTEGLAEDPEKYPWLGSFVLPTNKFFGEQRRFDGPKKEWKGKPGGSGPSRGPRRDGKPFGGPPRSGGRDGKPSGGPSRGGRRDGKPSGGPARGGKPGWKRGPGGGRPSSGGRPSGRNRKP